MEEVMVDRGGEERGAQEGNEGAVSFGGSEGEGVWKKGGGVREGCKSLW